MRRILFPISLNGAGTTDVESLPSYIHRVAIAHGVSVGQILSLVNMNVGDSFRFNTSYIRPEEMICKTNTTDNFISAFELATGKKLLGSTFWIVNGLIGRSVKEIISGFRWCPECINDMNQTEGAYFKLIWHLRSVSACHIHRTPLISCCQNCKHDQTSYRKRENIGFCQNCGHSLGLRAIPLLENNIASSWDDIGYDILEFLRDISDVDPIELKNEGLYKSLLDLHVFYSDTGRIDEFNKIVNPEDLRNILYRRKPVSLMVVRRIAFGFGVPLFSFLTGDVMKTISLIDSRDVINTKKYCLESRQNVNHVHADVLRSIDSARKIYPPLSLKSISKYVGISVGYIEYRLPLVKNQIVEAHSNYVKEKELRNLYQAQAKALSFFYDEKYSKCNKSRKQAYKVLREETGLPKFVLKKAIQTAYEVMIGSDESRK